MGCVRAPPKQWQTRPSHRKQTCVRFLCGQVTFGNNHILREMAESEREREREVSVGGEGGEGAIKQRGNGATRPIHWERVQITYIERLLGVMGELVLVLRGPEVGVVHDRPEVISRGDEEE